jgi:hypothetical protein
VITQYFTSHVPNFVIFLVLSSFARFACFATKQAKSGNIFCKSGYIFTAGRELMARVPNTFRIFLDFSPEVDEATHFRYICFQCTLWKSLFEAEKYGAQTVPVYQDNFRLNSLFRFHS